MTLPVPKYFESHVTLEPVLEEHRIETLKNICKDHGYKLADLFLQKRKEDKPERSTKDSFCTARDKDYEILKERMLKFVSVLQEWNYKIWRMKIESVLYDERINEQ